MEQNKHVAPEINPVSASLTGRYGDCDRIMFVIEIEVEEFTFRERTYSGPVMLESIDFGVIDWKELAHREFPFPPNPEDGYVDGWLCWECDSMPADLLKITFRDADSSSISATLTIEFDYDYPLTDPDRKPEDYTFQWDLRIDVNVDELNEVYAEIEEFQSDPVLYRPDIEHPVLGKLSWEKMIQNYSGQTNLYGQVVRFGLVAPEPDDVDALIETASELTLDLHEVADAAATFLQTHWPSERIEVAGESSTRLKSFTVYPGGAAVLFFIRGTKIKGLTMASDRSFELL
jgi:hypothetical protein